MAVSSSRYTGAAAVAELWCRALHSVGVEASLLFVRGDNLERRLAGASWGRAELVKDRRPSELRKNLSVLREHARRADAMMTFLPHVHLEAVGAGAHRRTAVVRVFRHPRHLRTDPLHRWFDRRAEAAIAPFDMLLESARRHVRGRPVAAFTVPVEDRFSADAPADPPIPELAHLDGQPIVGMVGKLAAGRGFELLLEAASKCTRQLGLLVVGHGELQEALADRAQSLGLNDRVYWAGKREADLPELYRAMDVVLFASPGSDWGHRAVSEAQACGRPVVAVEHPGVEDLVTNLETGLLVKHSAAAVAEAFDRLLSNPDLGRQLGRAAVQCVANRRFVATGKRLKRFLQSLTTQRR